MPEPWSGITAMILLFGGSAVIAWGVSGLLDNKKAVWCVPILVGICMAASLIIFHRQIGVPPAGANQGEHYYISFPFN